MAKASDLRNKMGTGGVGGIAGSIGGFGNAPTKAPASIIVPSEKDADLRKDKNEHDHSHEKAQQHSGNSAGHKAAKPLGGAGGAAGRPKV